MRKLRSFGIILAALWLAACETSGQGYMQQQQLLRLMSRPEPPLVVDVRSLREYRAGHVPGALHLPFWTAFAAVGLQDVGKGQMLVLYCEHGPRAGVAKLALNLAGFRHVVYLAGHMSAWRRAGLAMEK